MIDNSQRGQTDLLNRNMNSLSENNNNSIITTSYQQNKVTLSSVTNMTTSPTSRIPDVAATNMIDTKNVNEIWKNNFNSKNTRRSRMLDLKNTKITSWGNLNNNNNNNNNNEQDASKLMHNDEDDSDNISIKSSTSNNGKIEVEKCSNDDGNDNGDTNASPTSPSHHARRPMNAFLIFCKKHRPIVRKKFPALENRGVTRILGEWWSLLDCKDKDPYTQLAKQYKDAFFTANPDFKWYKLPAPPLRTLPTRPTKNESTCSSLSPPISPTNITMNMINPQNTLSSTATTTMTSNPTADFTPGKLADESQLGMLSSLLNANSYTTKVTTNDNNSHNNGNTHSNITNCNEKTPTGQCSEPIDSPPKPLKKRFSDNFTETTSSTHNNQPSDEATTNNKLIRNLFDETRTPNENEETDVRNELFDDGTPNGRKSFRKGKGNRYADIMANGKLIKNKRSSTDKLNNTNSNGDSCGPTNANAKMEKLDLNNTIKRLEERISSQNTTSNNNNGCNNNTISKQMTNDTILNNSLFNNITSICTNINNNYNNNSIDFQIQSGEQRTRTISEISDISDVADYSKAIPSFDLDARIAQLPNLLYDTYVQRKKEMKKRKTPKVNAKIQIEKERRERDNDKVNRKRGHDEMKDGTSAGKIGNNKTLPVGHGKAMTTMEKQTGSKKRKNKHNITHLENNSLVHIYDNDLSGLTTLAEIAAYKEKIDDVSLSETNQNNNNT